MGSVRAETGCDGIESFSDRAIRPGDRNIDFVVIFKNIVTVIEFSALRQQIYNALRKK